MSKPSQGAQDSDQKILASIFRVVFFWNCADWSPILVGNLELSIILSCSVSKCNLWSQYVQKLERNCCGWLQLHFFAYAVIAPHTMGYEALLYYKKMNFRCYISNNQSVFVKWSQLRFLGLRMVSLASRGSRGPILHKHSTRHCLFSWIAILDVGTILVLIFPQLQSLCLIVPV